MGNVGVCVKERRRYLCSAVSILLQNVHNCPSRVQQFYRSVMLHHWILPPTLSHNATKPKITSQEGIISGSTEGFFTSFFPLMSRYSFRFVNTRLVDQKKIRCQLF